MNNKDKNNRIGTKSKYNNNKHQYTNKQTNKIQTKHPKQQQKQMRQI